MVVDEAQGAAPSDLSCFGGEAIALVALEAMISVIGVDVDRPLLRFDRLDAAHRDVRVQLMQLPDAVGRASMTSGVSRH